LFGGAGSKKKGASAPDISFDPARGPATKKAYRTSAVAIRLLAKSLKANPQQPVLAEVFCATNSFLVPN
jgi:hypothetical protein